MLSRFDEKWNIICYVRQNFTLKFFGKIKFVFVSAWIAYGVRCHTIILSHFHILHFFLLTLLRLIFVIFHCNHTSQYQPVSACTSPCIYDMILVVCIHAEHYTMHTPTGTLAGTIFFFWNFGITMLIIPITGDVQIGTDWKRTGWRSCNLSFIAFIVFKNEKCMNKVKPAENFVGILGLLLSPLFISLAHFMKTETKKQKKKMFSFRIIRS